MPLPIPLLPQPRQHGHRRASSPTPQPSCMGSQRSWFDGHLLIVFWLGVSVSVNITMFMGKCT